MTLESISQELMIAEKTVRNWKKEGNWDNKRKSLMDTKTDFHEDIFLLARKIMKLLTMDIDRQVAAFGAGDEEQGKSIESRINCLSRLLDKLPKTKDYEAVIKNERRAEDEKEKGVSKIDYGAQLREIMNG